MKFEGQKIQDAIDRFPETFGLRGFPGKLFRIGYLQSYVNDAGKIMLYTQIQIGDQWVDFAKGTIAELQSQVVGWKHSESHYPGNPCSPRCTGYRS